MDNKTKDEGIVNDRGISRGADKGDHTDHQHSSETATARPKEGEEEEE